MLSNYMMLSFNCKMNPLSCLQVLHRISNAILNTNLPRTWDFHKFADDWFYWRNAREIERKHIISVSFCSSFLFNIWLRANFCTPQEVHHFKWQEHIEFTSMSFLRFSSLWENRLWMNFCTTKEEVQHYLWVARIHWIHRCLYAVHLSLKQQNLGEILHPKKKFTRKQSQNPKSLASNLFKKFNIGSMNSRNIKNLWFLTEHRNAIQNFRSSLQFERFLDFLKTKDTSHICNWPHSLQFWLRKLHWVN